MEITCKPAIGMAADTPEEKSFVFTLLSKRHQLLQLSS